MAVNVIDSFLSMLLAERGASEKTILAYGADLRDLSQFLHLKKIKIHKATNQHLKAYLQSDFMQHASAKTQNRRLSSMRSFYKFLYSEDIIKTNPCDYLLSAKMDKSLPKYLSPAEVEALINGAKSNGRMYVLLEILYATGIRVSELVAMPLSATLGDKNTLNIMGKGNKERMVPLNDMAIKALEKWLFIRDIKLKKGRKSKWLFPSTSQLGHLTRDGFYKALKKIALSVGIDAKKVSPHVFRHSFASHLVENEADLLTIQKILGHADIATTEIYTHIMPDRLHKTMQKAHPLSQSNIKDKQCIF